jgi:cytochrome c553
MKILIFIFLTAAHADVKQKAAACTACHGEHGISNSPLWPNLAGQKAEYLSKELRAFRDGSRVDPLMSPVSKMLSEEDVKELAQYFATLKGAP